MATPFTLKEDSWVELRFTAKDDMGNPAEAEPGSIQWTKDAGNVQLFPSQDGKQCIVFAPAGSAGAARVVSQGDADLGAGVKLVTDTVDITVIKRPASVATIEVGAPVDGPPPMAGGGTPTPTTTTPAPATGSTTTTTPAPAGG